MEPKINDSAPIRTPPVPSLSPNKNSILIIVISILLLGLLGGVSYLAYQNQQLKQSLIRLQAQQPQPLSSPTPTLITPTDLSNTTKPSNHVSEWTEISGSVYSLSFPNDWELTKAIEDLNSYVGQFTILTSPSKNTQLIIQPPNGWGHTAEPTKETDISLKIGKNTYQGREILFQSETSSNIYTHIPITDLLHQEGAYSIRYGNDYPTYLRNADKSSTLEQYELDKQTINQILSTFKFTNQKTEAESVTVARTYLDAYTTQNWETAKSTSTTDFNAEIAASYKFIAYKIIGSKPDTKDNYYHVFIEFTDSSGAIHNKAINNEPLEVLMYKNDLGEWKALTWYFYP